MDTIELDVDRGPMPHGGLKAGPAERLAYLDNIKTVLIAGIIAAHAIMGYSEFGSWTYQDVREATISPALEMALTVPVAIGSLFLMGLFFMVAGLLTHDALARKGPGRFARDRLRRLGAPFAVYVLVVWPVLEYALTAPILHEGPYWTWLTHQDPLLDAGPMWFVGVLLLFSLVYAAWVRLRGHMTEGSSEPPSTRSIVLLICAVGLSTFVVRLVFPLGSEQILQAHLWQWPQCVVMFGLGVTAAARGWLRPVPDGLCRRAGLATLAVALAMVLAIGTAASTGYEPEDFYGGWGPFALLYAMLEGMLAIAGSIWALGFAQRRLAGTGPMRAALARSSYAAFMLQGPVLVGLALLFRQTELPVDAKAILVAALGVAGSFALAWPLVSRTPLRRIL